MCRQPSGFLPRMQWSSGTGVILRPGWEPMGANPVMKRLPILLTITTGLALASVLGLNATLELQTNWLQLVEAKGPA
jgi:hypothetical protein